MRPIETDDRPTNGYAYVLRTDPAYAKARGVGLMDLTKGIRTALGAEGAPMNHANWLLPAHAVFQAKNAYGYGYPWSDPRAREDVSYDLDQYPIGQQCIDTCLWGINNHRPPNGEREVEALAGAIRKVYENLDDVPAEESAS